MGRQSGPAALNGFCLLKTLLTSGMKDEERTVELCICKVSDVVEVMRLMGLSW